MEQAQHGLRSKASRSGLHKMGPDMKDMLDMVADQRNQALDALVEASAIIKAKDREIAALKEKYETENNNQQ